MVAVLQNLECPDHILFLLFDPRQPQAGRFFVGCRADQLCLPVDFPFAGADLFQQLELLLFQFFAGVGQSLVIGADLAHCVT